MQSDEDSDADEYDNDEPQTVAGNIHRESFRQFWTDTLKADGYIQEMLRSGYKLPFKEGCTPQKYKEKNNKSAMQNMGYAVEETEKWIARKVVKEVFEEPTCISPLTVAIRQIGDKEKLRLCLDLSRYINTLLRKEAVKLAGLDKCVQALLPGTILPRTTCPPLSTMYKYTNRISSTSDSRCQARRQEIRIGTSSS